MTILATRFIRGGARIGPVPLDCMVEAGRTLTATFSERRIADGAVTSDHSQMEPDELTISGVVDSLSPITGLGLLSYTTGQFLQYERLADLVRTRDPIEIVCPRGRFLVTARTFSVTDSKVTGFSTQFNLSCKSVLRGKSKVLAVPTDQSAGLVGDGTSQALGPTGTTDVPL